MQHLTLLLATRMVCGGSSDALHILKRCCQVWRITQKQDVLGNIEKHDPDIICFEFDCPDIQGLAELRDAKLRYPSIPILMITDQSSESLATWALKARVWDYFVQPVSEDELLESIDRLAGLLTRPKVEPERRLFPPTGTVYIPPEARFHGLSSTYRAIHRAARFIERDLHQEIHQSEVAKSCEMSPSQFSRSFKENYGMGFKEYIGRRRIMRAIRLLRNPNMTIADVSYSVGFSDPSYFTRTFRRFVGMTPSEFRRHPEASVARLGL
jgi:AraC-like DNA-binding protein/CheY-like chemotaxis protein